MKKARWSQIDAICHAFEAVAGPEIRCWVEDAGDVVAGDRPERHFTPCTQRVGGSDQAQVLAGVDGRGSGVWIDLFATVVRTTLEQQTTINDMASATARTWRQMNALLAMASSSSLGLEPGKTIQRIFDMLVRATRFEGGIAVVRLPGSDDCIQLDANGVARVPEDLLAGLEAVGETVRTFPEGAEEDEVLRACTVLLDPFKPGAVGRLQSDHDMFGWLIAATADTPSSDDLKLFGAAARIIAVALENAQTLTLEREATRTEVERELYQALARNAPVGLFRADLDGRLLYVNDRWCSVTGVSEALALREGWLCAVHEEDQAHVTAEWERMLVENKPVRCEHRCRRDDGQAWVLTEIAREVQDAGGYVGTMTDITERKRAEQEKAELEAHLRHAHKMEAVGTMAGGIAHDFNNILGAIVGNAELALGRIPDGDRARVHLDRLLQGALRARDLVRQMLTFSKQAEVQRQPQEVGPVIEEALALIRASVPSTVELRARLAPTGCNASVDATQIHQVVINLCTNAHQAIGEQIGEIEIVLESVEVTAQQARSLAADARPGRYARLSVVDSGPGMAAEIRGRVFEPFFTTRATGGGTGLGLAVVHGIASDHGGFVRVDNEPGRGARVDVYLPIHGAVAEAQAALQSARSTLREFARVGARDADGPAPASEAAAAAGLAAYAAAGELEQGASPSHAVAERLRGEVGAGAAGEAERASAEPLATGEDNSLEDLVATFLEDHGADQASEQPQSANALVPHRGNALVGAGSRALRAPGRAHPAQHLANRAPLGLPNAAPAQLPEPTPGRPSDAAAPHSPMDAATAAIPHPEGEDGLLERLVADFLATEQVGGKAAHAQPTDASAREDGAQEPRSNLPAVSGQRGLARGRAIDRAPRAERGRVKLLGSDRSSRLEYDPATKSVQGAAAPPALPQPDAPHEPPPAARAEARKLSFPFMIG